MLDSVRRVFSILFVVAIASFAANLLAANYVGCGLACLASIAPLALQPNLGISPNPGSTIAISPSAVAPWITMETIRLVSVYALIISLAALIILEVYDEHYTKAVFHRHEHKKA
jgi:hypothetical protein